MQKAPTYSIQKIWFYNLKL